MRIVIGGAGEVGDFLCMTLSGQNNDVVVIEKDPKVIDVLQNKYNVALINGDIRDMEVMRSAAVDRCDFFLSVGDDASANIIAASMAKALGAKNTVARMDSSMFMSNFLNYGSHFQRHFAIDMLVDPDRICAAEFAKIIRTPRNVTVENIASNQIEIQRCTVNSKSKCLGRTLRSIDAWANVRIVFITRDGIDSIPTPETVILDGDVVTVVGKHDDIALLLGKLDMHRATSAVGVAIFGTSGIAYALIRYLNSPKYKVVAIEESLAACEKLAAEFPNITVIHGDAAAPDLLNEEHVPSSSYFVACSSDDEKNTMVAIQAKHMGVRCVMLALNDGKYESVLSNISGLLGIERIVSKRVATAKELVSYVSPESYHILSEVSDSQCSFVEFRVEKSCDLIGKTIKTLGLPRGCVLVSLMRNFDAKVPSASDVVLENDRIVAAMGNALRDHVIQMFTGKSP